MTSSSGLYVYAVVAGQPEVTATGVDGAQLDVVADHDLSAVVHHHEGGPYTGPDDDVRRWVVEHSRVVDAIWESGLTVLPMSFNVIVAAGEDEPANRRLEGWLGSHADELHSRLDMLRDRVELRVEIGLDQHEVGRSDPRTDTVRAEIEDRPPGVQRLLRKRLERLERDLADALADDLYQDYRPRLAQVSEALVENRGARFDAGIVPVLSVSVLVPRDRADAVGRELAQVRNEQPAARIRYSGPWPPYSFTDVPGPADGTAH